jgi:hypothetical protein
MLLPWLLIFAAHPGGTAALQVGFLTWFGIEFQAGLDTNLWFRRTQGKNIGIFSSSPVSVAPGYGVCEMLLERADSREPNVIEETLLAEMPAKDHAAEPALHHG